MELPGGVVDPSWLRERLGSAGIVVADVRWTVDGSGRTQYEAGHIPGAIYLDADDDLSTPVGEGREGRHPLPSPEDFAGRMGEAGIGDHDAVVVYDPVRGSHAARLWWMLEVTGHRVALLDGGLDAWEGGLETGSFRREPATFATRPWPSDLIVDAAEVERVLHEKAAIVLDARAAERYRGEVEPIDRRAGHVPGALNAPWERTNLDPSSGRFLPPDELRLRYEALGVTDATKAVASCGSGITACLDLLAMEVAGLGRGRLYVGSWSGWISDLDRPIATGDEPQPSSR
jgi:thiosulfate/3-mercaptopyruvate sulfurtransferase